MKKLKFVISAMLLASVTLSFAACTSPDGTPDEPSDSEATTTETPTDTTAEITTPEATTEATTEPAPPKDLSEASLTDIFKAETYKASNGIILPYRIYVPEDYDASKSYPVVVFLHGSGERGNDNTSQLKNGIGHMFKKVGSPILDSIVIAPQCPSSMKWVSVSAWTECNYSTDKLAESPALRAVVDLLEDLPLDYNINKKQIYATGLSMGGFGTWDLLVRHGDMFAAGIPVCGGCDVSKAAELVNMPIMTFHGLKDPTVPCTGTQSMYNAIVAAGGTKIEFTPYENGVHNVWDKAYAEEGLAEWLFSQSK